MLQKFKEAIEEILKEKEKVFIGVPGGRSILPIFEKILELDIPFSKLEWSLVDERRVPIEDPDSNYFNNKEFFDAVKEKGSIIHPFQKDMIFDIVFLGTGEDGHICGLFPNHPTLNQEGSYVELDDSPKPPSKRISMSVSRLQKAKYSFILFLGEGKRKAYENYKNPEVLEKDCPAKYTRGIISIITDLD